MSMRSLLIRIAAKYRRTVSYRFCRRMIEISTKVPFISFSFDDAPRSAFSHGGDILKAHGALCTFFVSLGLLESESPSGTIAFQDDLRRAVEEGDELGCHTFDHKDSWETPTAEFEKSILENQRALTGILPDAVFKSFAYPICEPKPATKHRVGKLFNCCRGGGQTFNSGKTDFNLLKAFFLDIRTGANIETVKRLIDQNSECRGWLIFATHDVSNNPSPYGCTEELFEKVVSYSARSGARLLSVGKACQKLQVSGSKNAV